VSRYCHLYNWVTWIRKVGFPEPAWGWRAICLTENTIFWMKFIVEYINTSIQIVITQARNSRELSVTRNLRWVGISNRHAKPELILYPPIPNSEASKRWKVVGFLNTTLFIDIPLTASYKNEIDRCRSDISHNLMSTLSKSSFRSIGRATEWSATGWLEWLNWYFPRYQE
jgi:lipid-A-disaccharide synthase-like uncharacterized protein